MRTYIALGLVLLLAVAASATTMTLTAAGTTAGFTLSTFASGFQNGGGVGPVGITFPNAGKVLVSDYNNGVMYTFNDVDGQTPATAAPVVPLTYGGNVAGLITQGGNVYSAMQSSSAVWQLTTTGGFVSSIASGIQCATGIAGSGTTLYVSDPCGGGIYTVDSVTHAVGHPIGGPGVDGLTLSGNILYGEAAGSIVGWNVNTWAQVFNSGAISGGPDGAAVGIGSLAGNIFVNTNDGHVIEINLTTNVQTTIAQGGSRGDLIGVDPNGTLLLTQTDSIVRLTAPSGGGFQSQVPEPDGMALLGSGLLGLAGTLRRRFLS